MRGVKVTFSFNNNIPIYVQLVEQIKIHIISGRLSAGERLPSVRDLALKCKVNPNTLQRALSELEELGLVFTERTNGKFVTENQELIEKYKKEYADELSNKFIESMGDIGFDSNSSIKYLEEFGGRN